MGDIINVSFFHKIKFNLTPIIYLILQEYGNFQKT